MARNRVSHEFLPGRGQNVAAREAVFQLLRNRRQMVGCDESRLKTNCAWPGHCNEVAAPRQFLCAGA